MKLVKLIEFLRNRLKAVVRLCAAVLLLLVVGDLLLVDKASAHTDTERLPAFWALFGLIGCVVIIILSKRYGHAGILRREDYYEAPSTKEPED
jgi:TRAP-type C4-dicarboxylate transport system permease small subunit